MEFKDFPRNDYGGEMGWFERYRLFSWICEYKPKIIFEVGTGVGGGSTYHMAYALETINNEGVIYTCDPGDPNDIDRHIDPRLVEKYSNIKFFPIKSSELLTQLIENKTIPDFIFFDGPEEPEVALNDMIELEKYIKVGTMFAMHDWDHYRPFDNGFSTKAQSIRPYMENSENWELVELLRSDIKNCPEMEGEYDSVGLCLYKKIK